MSRNIQKLTDVHTQCSLLWYKRQSVNLLTTVRKYLYAMKKGGGSESTSVGPSKFVLVYALRSLENVLKWIWSLNVTTELNTTARSLIEFKSSIIVLVFLLKLTLWHLLALRIKLLFEHHDAKEFKPCWRRVQSFSSCIVKLVKYFTKICIYTIYLIFRLKRTQTKLENSDRLEVVDLPLMKPCWRLEIAL